MNLPEAIRTESFARQVYNAIRRGIRDGTIPRGRFFSEVEFGNSMGVSRTPVREALLVLYREGLVEIVNKRGFRLVELSDEDIVEIRLLRIALETLVVRRLCEHATADDVRAFREMLGEQISSKENMFELDEAFHVRLADVAGLRETGRVLMSVRGKMYLIPAGAPIPMMRTEAVIREHGEIVDAIGRRDAELGVQLVVDHINRSLDAFMAARASALAARSA
jgi:DNA-binding GntR family transcriptional regulator